MWCVSGDLDKRRSKRSRKRRDEKRKEKSAVATQPSPLTSGKISPSAPLIILDSVMEAAFFCPIGVWIRGVCTVHSKGNVFCVQSMSMCADYMLISSFCPTHNPLTLAHTHTPTHRGVSPPDLIVPATKSGEDPRPPPPTHLLTSPLLTPQSRSTRGSPRTLLPVGGERSSGQWSGRPERQLR